jgi:hypothetical protein
MNNVPVSIISILIMFSFTHVDVKNGVYFKPVVYCWCIQNTTECGLLRDSKGIHVTLSGVCLLNYIFKNFVMKNCRCVVSLMVKWVSLHIYKLFQGIHKVFFIDDLHYFYDLICRPSRMRTLLMKLWQFLVSILVRIREKVFFFIWF